MDTAQPEQPADLAVVGRVLTMNAAREIVPDGAVIVAGGDIVAVGARETLMARHAPRRVLGDSRSIVMPGLIDAHTHCTQCFVRALVAGELPMIPRIYNPAQRALSPAEAAATVRLIAAQLLRSGVTTLCEGTLNRGHEDAILEALEAIGIRCLIARGMPDQDAHHAALYSQITDRSWVKARQGEAELDLARTEELLRRYPNRGRGLIRAAVNASGLPGFSESYFRGAAALAESHGTTLHVHIGRDREEVELSLAVWGRRPIERLADLGALNERLVAIHAVLASEAEIRLLAESGAGVAHAPVECVANLNAVPNIPQFRRAGIPIALGCDVQANDLFVTMRAAWLLHNALWGLPRYDPEALSAAELLAMATSESARVLHCDDRIGSLEVGKAADITVLDGAAPHLMAMQDLETELVRFASRAEVRHVLVEGRTLLENGRPTTIDLERLYAEAEAGARHVRDTVSSRRYRPLRRE